MSDEHKPDGTPSESETRVQYVANGEDLLTIVRSSIVPAKDQYVMIDGEEWRANHVTHTIEDGAHVATVFVWQPDGGWDDEKIGEIVRETLRYQRRAERDRDE